MVSMAAAMIHDSRLAGFLESFRRLSTRYSEDKQAAHFLM